MHVLDGRGYEADLLTELRHVRVEFLAVVAHEFDEFVDHLVKDRLRDGGVGVGHGRVAVGLAALRGKPGKGMRCDGNQAKEDP